MDGWVRVLRPFNSISVISRRWKGEHERLCAMKRRLGSGRILPPAGFEPATPWSEVGSAFETYHMYDLDALLHFYKCPATFSTATCSHLSHIMRKPVFAICEQQRRWSAYASMQSDQHLCCSLPRQYISSFFMCNFKPLANLCSWAGRLESYLVANSWRQVFLWRGSVELEHHNWSVWKRFGSIATFKVHSEDQSDWADAQVDVSFRWTHRSFCWFYQAQAHMHLSVFPSSEITLGNWTNLKIWGLIPFLYIRNCIKNPLEVPLFEISILFKIGQTFI